MKQPCTKEDLEGKPFHFSKGWSGRQSSRQLIGNESDMGRHPLNPDLCIVPSMIPQKNMIGSDKGRGQHEVTNLCMKF